MLEGRTVFKTDKIDHPHGHTTRLVSVILTLPDLTNKNTDAQVKVNVRETTKNILVRVAHAIFRTYLNQKTLPCLSEIQLNWVSYILSGNPMSFTLFLPSSYDPVSLLPFSVKCLKRSVRILCSLHSHLLVLFHFPSQLASFASTPLRLLLSRSR